jgi:DNA-3-methyladenine glycosylase I
MSGLLIAGPRRGFDELYSYLVRAGQLTEMPPEEVLKLSTKKAGLRRCAWAMSPRMIEYHDTEWGVPVHDDRRLFEFLILEGAQAGLSWETILNKRENYRRAFDRFDPVKIARYDRRKVRKLLANAGIVRNRLKIAATIANAQAFLAVQRDFGTFDHYVWQFASGRPKANPRRSRRPPARTARSDALSKDLKKRGFRFVGSTICYAFMQATGMVDDHAFDCFRRLKISAMK